MKRLIPVAFAILFLFDRGALQPCASDRVQTIGNIFEVPIQTLNAIKKLVQGTRPISSSLQNPQQQQQQQQLARPPTSYSSSYYPYSSSNYVNYNQNKNDFRSRAARIAGLYTAADGSGFKI